jgi:hypothetical protein
MTISITDHENSEIISRHAKSLRNKIVNLSAKLNSIQAQMVTDDYTLLIKDLPSDTLKLTEGRDAVIAEGLTADVVALLTAELTGTSQADLNNFVNDAAAISTALVSNVALFEPSYSGTRLVFEASPGSGAKAALNNLINTALAHLV